MLTKLKIYGDQGTWFDWFFTYAHKQEIKSVGERLFRPVQAIVVGRASSYGFRPPLLPRIYDNGLNFISSLKDFTYLDIINVDQTRN